MSVATEYILTCLMSEDIMKYIQALLPVSKLFLGPQIVGYAYSYVTVLASTIISSQSQYNVAIYI